MRRSLLLTLMALLTSPIAGSAATRDPYGAIVPVKAVAPENADRSVATILDQVRQAWFKREWQAYKAKFITQDGRVVDNANGGVSHSEGQGYGMLLAAIADDRETFASLWTWTERQLMVRPDGLAAWKWDPNSHAVVDKNNASDGDLLIAWALARAAKRFDRPDYGQVAARIARAIAATVFAEDRSKLVLLPGAFGFTAKDQRDGPVVNLSYYVFPAFDDLQAVAPEIDWSGMKAAGLALLEQSRFGPLSLPSDWISLGGDVPKPAQGFPRTFGYDAIRIPLYLAWAGRPEAGRARFATLWNARADLGPFVTDIDNGSALRTIDGVGFKLISALSACLARGTPVPGTLISSRDTFYYPATMRLLGLAVIQERYSQCL